MTRSVFAAGIIALSFLTVRPALAQDITTIAGTGTAGFSGDGGSATSAKLNYAQDIALDTFGNIYIADAANQRIRKITAATGIITTVAGTGVAGYSGDGGAAISALLSAPIGIATDLTGNVYICDNGNHAIRKLTVATGIITTVAGSGASGSSGDGGAATAAKLYGPYDIAVDAADNIYIADVSNNKIRKVTAATGVISTVAGTGAGGFGGDGAAATSAQLFHPFSVAVDASGNLYITDAGNYRVRKVTAATGIISTIAGTGTSGSSGDGGAATAARFNTPYGVAVNSAGDVYISDFNNYRVRRIQSGIINTVAGTGTLGYSGDGGPAVAAKLGEPRGLFLDRAGNLFLADYDNSAIRFVCFAAAVPGAPLVSSPLTLCMGSTAVPLSAIGSGLKWYTAATGGSPLPGAPVPATTATGSVTYYVSQSSACGESPRTALVVNVVSAPAAPVVSSPVLYCSGTTASALTATGSGLKWYTAATGGVGSSVAPIPSTATAGSSTWYVSQGSTGCESPRSAITVTVNPSPAAPLADPDTFYYCLGATAKVLAATGTNLKWYATATGGTAATIAPVPATAVEGIVNYYVSQSAVSGCESPRTAIMVQTSPRPDVAITAKAAPLFFHCKGSSITLKAVVVPYGLKYQWQSGGTDIAGANMDSLKAFDDGMYSLIVSNGPDCADTAFVSVVQDSSFILTTLSPVDVNICDGVAIKLYASPASGTGLSYEWYRNGVAIPFAASSGELEAGTAGTYTVKISNSAGCIFSSNPAVVSTYTPVPKPVVTRIGTVLSLPAGYDSYQWYRNDKAIAGADKYLFSLSFDGSYFALVTDKNGCKNYSDTVVIAALSATALPGETAWQVYPSLTDDKVQIHAPFAVQVRVSDISGKICGVYQDVTEISLGTLPDGMYFFVISDASGRLLGREKVQKFSK